MRKRGFTVRRRTHHVAVRSRTRRTRCSPRRTPRASCSATAGRSSVPGARLAAPGSASTASAAMPSRRCASTGMVRVPVWTAQRVRNYRCHEDRLHAAHTPGPHLRADPLPAARASARGGRVQLPRHGDLVRLRDRDHADRHPGADRRRCGRALARGPGAVPDRAARGRGDPEPVPAGSGGRALVAARGRAPRRPGDLEGPRVPPAAAAARDPLLHRHGRGARLRPAACCSRPPTTGPFPDGDWIGSLEVDTFGGGARRRAGGRADPAARHPGIERARPPVRLARGAAARLERRPGADGPGPPSFRTPARASSPRATRSAGGSSATCTTALSSGWSLWP